MLNHYSLTRKINMC